MGCSESKLDSLPAVSLCRDRCKYLDHALRHLNALAKAHVAYTRSLQTSGAALRLFFDRHIDGSGTGTGSVSTRPLTHKLERSKSPTTRAKSNAIVATGSPSSSSSSHSSDSHSHIKFDTDSEADEKPGRRLPDSQTPQTSRYIHEDLDYYNPESLNVFFDKFTSIKYMKKQPTLPETYAHRPVDDNPYEIAQHFNRNEEPPPPPPPAPTNSTWDFLNFFDPYEMPFGSRRRDPRDVPMALPPPIYDKEEKIDGSIWEAHARHEEGKEAAVVMADDVWKTEEGNAGGREYRDDQYEAMTTRKEEREKAEGEEKVTVNSVMREAVREVEALFEKAAEGGDEVLRLLNDRDIWGSVRYFCRVNAAKADETAPFIGNNVDRAKTTKMKKKDSSAAVMGIDGDSRDAAVVGSRANLPSILKKLFMWEKKLLHEVKAEEKLRVFYARKCRELKQLTDKGAEASKIETTQALIESLSTRLKISFQVIDKISLKITKMCDDELCPLMSDLIHSLLKMWRVMLDCHRGQFRAIAGAGNLDGIRLDLNGDASSLDVLLQLKLEIHSLNMNFSNWVNSQAGCVGALRGWMVGCVGTEPEEVADAPLVSVMCSRWFRVLGRVKEKDVFDAFRDFGENLSQVMEIRQNLYLQAKQGQDKEMERKMRNFEKEDHKMNRAVLERDKRLNGGLRHGRWSSVTRKIEVDKASLQESLKGIFEAMERFALESMEAYEDLIQCTRRSDDKRY